MLMQSVIIVSNTPIAPQLRVIIDIIKDEIKKSLHESQFMYVVFGSTVYVIYIHARLLVYCLVKYGLIFIFQGFNVCVFNG